MLFHRTSTRWTRAALVGCVFVLPLALSVLRLEGGYTPVQAEGTTVVVDGLMWATENNRENVNWNTANQYCEDSTLGGHSDWRLPTVEELEALYDPASDAEFHIRSPFELDSCCLWSSTLLEDADDGDPRRRLDPSRYAYGLYFANGDRYYSAMGFPDGRAMCVRAS